MPASTRLTIARAVYGMVLVGSLLVAAVTAVAVQRQAERVVDAALERAVVARTRSAAQEIARLLHDDWMHLKYLERQIGGGDPEQVRVLMDAARAEGHEIAWAGFADLTGRVVVASGGLLEGVDVSARPWFQRGLQGDTAEDLHEALLLNRLLGGTDNEPLRFIDIAGPVTDGEAVRGVLAFHITTEWLAQLLREAALVRELDLYLVNPAGDVVLSSASDPPGRMELQILRAAATGVPASGREIWPDGQEWFTAIHPEVAYRDLPSFGWRLMGRITPDAVTQDVGSTYRTIGIILVALFLALLATALVFDRLFIRPIRQLALSAERIADGEEFYIPEVRGSREARRLSAALARIQSLLQAG